MPINQRTPALYSAFVTDTVPETDIPHVRYTSGLFLYDEVFLDGRLLGRWWSSDGGIRPEMHYRWNKWFTDSAPQLPADAFTLAIEGETLRNGWRLLGVDEQPDTSGFRGEGRPIRHCVIRLAHERRPIEVAVHTRIDGSAFMLRWLEITNTGDTPTAISNLAPWTGQIWNHRADEHTPPGAESPFEVAYNHHVNWGEEGDFWWEPLDIGTKSFDGGHKGHSGWSRPAFLVRNRANGETLWAELGWSGNWGMHLVCANDDKKNHVSLQFALGPEAADQALRVIDAGETVKSPVIHLALFHTDIDTCVQAAHEHVRHVVMPAQLPGKNQLIEANHRGYICDRESEAGIKGEIDIAAAVGAELFVIDAGWYGHEPNLWAQNVGDWNVGPWLPEGLEPIADYAHEKGLRFGLWMEIESIGKAARLREKHPDWVLTRDGQPVANERALDLANPEVVAWMEAQIVHAIRAYKLDHFRIDYNTRAGEGGNRVYQGFTENTIWRHCEAIYGIFDRVRPQFPDVLFENCASGGGRLDWEMLRRFQITEISDWMRAPRALKILYGLTYALPPEICVRTFGTEAGEHMLEGDVDYQLRSVLLAHPIFRGISPTLAELNPHYKARIAHAVELYKTIIRPLLPTCRVFHHNGPLPLFEQTPWCVLEYGAADRGQAIVALFRTADHGDDSYVIRPKGLERGRDYEVTFDNSGETVRYRGVELVDAGIRITLPATQTSELLLIKAS